MSFAWVDYLGQWKILYTTIWVWPSRVLLHCELHFELHLHFTFRIEFCIYNSQKCKFTPEKLHEPGGTRTSGLIRFRNVENTYLGVTKSNDCGSQIPSQQEVVSSHAKCKWAHLAHEWGEISRCECDRKGMSPHHLKSNCQCSTTLLPLTIRLK